MRQQFKRAAGAVGWVVAAAAMTACGGGGDSPAKTASNGTADPYVGNYLAACVQEGSANSYRVRYSVVKKSQTTADVTTQYVAYSGVTCAGTGTPVSGNAGTETWTITGTKTASGKTVDKISIVDTGMTIKDIAYTDGTRVIFGNFGGSLDSEGYPVELDNQDDDALTRI